MVIQFTGARRQGSLALDGRIFENLKFILEKSENIFEISIGIVVATVKTDLVPFTYGLCQFLSTPVPIFFSNFCIPFSLLWITNCVVVGLVS